MKAAPREVSEVSRLSEEERQAALRAVLRRPLLIASVRAPGGFCEGAAPRGAAEGVVRAAHGLDARSGCGVCALYKVPARLDDATHPAFLPKDELPFTRRATCCCVSRSRCW